MTVVYLVEMLGIRQAVHLVVKWVVLMVSLKAANLVVERVAEMVGSKVAY